LRTDHCGEIVLDDENNPVTRGSVHPATYVAHCLLKCTVHDALRVQLHSEGVTYLEAKRRKRGAGVLTLLLIRDAQKAVRAQVPLAPGTMEFDPRKLTGGRDAKSGWMSGGSHETSELYILFSFAIKGA
jgi:hypothetical protein